MSNSENIEIMPKTVRAILNIDNEEIINLCKTGDIPLKRNKKGLTYFTGEDVKTLQKLNDIQKSARHLEKQSAKLNGGLENVSENNSENSIEQHPLQITENINQKLYKDTALLLKQITGSVKNIENGIYDKFSDILEEKLEDKLEEKLGGLDEVIIDLVRAKTENETLRKRISENEKLIYSLKNELSKYSKLAGKLYIKNDKNSNEII